MSEKIFVGIDPGTSKNAPGAIAFLCGEDYCVYDWCNQSEAIAVLKRIKKTADKCGMIIAIEKVHSAPGQGISSSFKFGENFGFWQGISMMTGWPVVLVSPQTWQKGLVPKSTPANRKPSLDVARRLFPKADLKYKKNHGRADALLIADWVRRGRG
jgi:hypothetical protein